MDRVASWRRMVARRWSAMEETAFASPSMKGSTPMKPVPGAAIASATRCSPPPKPISSRMSSTGTGKSAASGFAGVSRSSASAGSVSANSPERRAEALALPPAVQAAPPLLAHRRAGDAARRQRDRVAGASARSVFSQEKPPSASAGRPKWP
jgi:hypothetical protein